MVDAQSNACYLSCFPVEEMKDTAFASWDYRINVMGLENLESCFLGAAREGVFGV